jgi:DNA repair exonuclease SbcCD nuclease subunit
VKIAHLADLHLGLRQYSVERRGMNLREQDMLAAFDHAVNAIIEQKPDMVIIAGDMFDSPLIPRHSIQKAIQITKRLAASLQNETTIVAIGGNHDTPKTPDDRAHVLLILREAVPSLRVHVFHPEVITFYIGDKKVCLGTIPSSHSPSTYLEKPDSPIVTPKPGADYNILVIHGLQDVVAQMTGYMDMTWYVHPGYYDPSEWHYIAWGHYHEYTVMTPNEIYCGSLENTSFPTSDEPNGYVLTDLSGNQLQHKLVPVPSRRHISYDIEDESQIEQIAGNEDAIREAVVKLRIRYTMQTRDRIYDLSRQAQKLLRDKCAILLIDRIRDREAEEQEGAQSIFSDKTKTLEERWAEFVRTQVEKYPVSEYTAEEIIDRGLQALVEGGRE